jgi:oxygen-independent coproporphyrinogen-3 oxidase
MPATLPAGEPVPDDGGLPPSAYAGLGTRPFGVYVHVPFCAARCGYCDFNTYTPGELGATTSPQAYLDAALAEVRLARRVLGATDLPVQTVFFGGGTPTLLPAADLGRVLRAVDAEFGLAPGAEVTSEANPESVGPACLSALRGAGVNRLSVGMQSAVPHVLEVLDRQHTPGQPEAVVRQARAVGFDSVSLDLIYGAPGESVPDWKTSLAAAVAAEPDHVSAYALVVEEGTALARRVARGEVPAPDDDDLADKYAVADEVLSAAGYAWYEVSNWARPGHECRHNLGYWQGADWWGIGPGAHSCISGVRWWNRRHPAGYAARLAAGRSPAQGREVLSAEDRRIEDVLLAVRLAAGFPAAGLGELVDDGLVTVAGSRAVLTLRGRLLADAVVRRLLP